MSDTPSGRFCWYELLTDDADAASAFYTSVIGWGTHDFQAGDRPYTNWMNDGTPVGGMMEMPPGVPSGTPPHWLTYVSTPEIDAFTATAEKLGGKILHRMDIDEIGRIAILSDPAGGACFAAFEPSGHAPGHDGERKVGEVSWNELSADDLEAAWSFYSELCGWRETSRGEMGAAGTYLMFGRGDVDLGGMYKRPDEMPFCNWLPYVRVEDATHTSELVKKHGGIVVDGPMEVPGGDFVTLCKDPQGAMFAVHSTAS